MRGPYTYLGTGLQDAELTQCDAPTGNDISFCGEVTPGLGLSRTRDEGLFPGPEICTFQLL